MCVWETHKKVPEVQPSLHLVLRLSRFDPQTGWPTGSNDLNLVNLFLRLFGKCTEEELCVRLLCFQVNA